MSYITHVDFGVVLRREAHTTETFDPVTNTITTTEINTGNTGTGAQTQNLQTISEGKEKKEKEIDKDTAVSEADSSEEGLNPEEVPPKESSSDSTGPGVEKSPSPTST